MLQNGVKYCIIITVMDYMKIALRCAERALRHDDVPIGAIVVRDGVIIARGENQVQMRRNPTLHAEIVAINRACKKLNTKFLYDCEIYVSLEPCAMCATAISLARIKRIIFAADDPKGGAIKYNTRIYDTDHHLWRPEWLQDDTYAAESADMLRAFFVARRG